MQLLHTLDKLSQSRLILCNRTPTLARQYMFTSRYYFYREGKGEKENKERSNHFCLTKNNNESPETKFKHVWVFFAKVIWIHLWIKPKARKRQDRGKMLSRCVFPFLFSSGLVVYLEHPLFPCAYFFLTEYIEYIQGEFLEILALNIDVVN